MIRFAILLLVSVGLCPSAEAPRFVNIAKASGLDAVIPNGGDESKTWILETTGSGAAWVDFDNDGDLDAFLVSGEGGSNRMYRNLGSGRFEDATRELRLESEGWGQGVCAGDYDNDGYTDLFVTYWGANRLYRNIAGRRFDNVAPKAGLIQPDTRYNTGCAFLDYDRDGDLDLFVANYLVFDFETTPKPGDNPYCFYRNAPAACGPRGLPFDRNLLYRNEGNGRFLDVSDESGISRPRRNYALGAVTGDFDGDGWTDLYVACDRTPSILYINQQDGTFEDEAMFRGAALDENGQALSGMGVAVSDFDGNGSFDIFRTNFSDERSTLYRNRGEGDFDEATVQAGMGRNTRYVGWGAGFFDYDLDGLEDLMLVNGHVFPEVDRLDTDIRFRQNAILYHNLGGGEFADISREAGPAFAELHAARGAAFGDMDGDGAIEILVNNQNEAPSLFDRQTQSAGSWITLQLEGTTSNRSAIGARVTLRADGTRQVREVRSGGSYLSQSDLRLHFGLGNAGGIQRIEIQWPSGAVQILEGLESNRAHHIREPVSAR
ncbi:MAG: CRTAC1 family protein [Bryobacterales bacterium]